MHGLNKRLNKYINNGQATTKKMMLAGFGAFLYYYAYNG